MSWIVSKSKASSDMIFVDTVRNFVDGNQNVDLLREFAIKMLFCIWKIFSGLLLIIRHRTTFEEVTMKN